MVCDVRPRQAIVVGLLTVLVVGAAGGGYYYWRKHRPTPPAVAPKTAVILQSPSTPVPTIAPVATPPPTAPPTPTPLPSSVRLAVPFTSQAPYHNMDRTHEEYCEAAAVLMIGDYYKHDQRSVIPPGEADRDMTSIVAYERQTFPGVLDLFLPNIATTGAAKFQMDGTVEPAPADPQIIKQYLAGGLPVVIPVMTHGLPGGQRINPHYGATNVYHVIVLIGYDESGQFISNDAGIFEGQYLTYSWSTLSTAMDAQAQKYPGNGRNLLVFRQRA
jgi:hypothetical protein